MSGTLFHSKAFDVSYYIGNDGQPHFEVLPVDGDSISLTHFSWKEMLEYFRALGVPADAWPTYDSYIDLPLADARSRNKVLSAHLQRVGELPEEAPYWAKFVSAAVQRGELVFFTHE